MAERVPKIDESQSRDGQGNLKAVPSNAGRGRELTHQEDYDRNGDYLGRRPEDVSGRNHFDEEYFVDENEA